MPEIQLKKRIFISLALHSMTVVIGLVVGLLVNLLWYLFTALVVGWGDSAPDWYIEIQGRIFYGIMFASVIVIIFVFRFLSKKGESRPN